MVTIVGKVLYEGLPAADASVQLRIYDPSNDIERWTEVVKSDNNGRYQIAFSDIRDFHQNFSEHAEILVAAWDDELERIENHTKFGSRVHEYNGEALLIADVALFEGSQCDYFLQNNAISITEAEIVPYTPVFESTNQAMFFHGERVFIQSAITDVLMSNGADFIEVYDLQFRQTGEFTIDIKGITSLGASIFSTLSVLVTEAESSASLQFDNIDFDKGLAFFAVRDRGIRDNLFNASIYSSSRYTLTNVKFFVDDIMVREVTDFSSPLVSIALTDTEEDSRNVKMVAVGVEDGSVAEVEYIYEKPVKNFKTIEADIAVSLDPDSGLHTAAINIPAGSDVNEILWQIIYKSTIVERVVKVTDADEKALINVLYQEYTDPSTTTIEFETLQPGNYTIVAYVINSVGVYFEASEDLFVPGGGEEEQPINVGDSITVGCLSNHGEVPIMTIYRLSRDGYVEVVSVPMDHAFDRTYFYDYTVEENDSFYIFKAADSVVVKKVGVPRGCAIAYSKNKGTGREISFQLQDFSGNTIDEGLLDDSGFGIYYKVMSENVHGVLVVGNTHKVV
jgi:hypothetical protein